ncbi:Hypothetical protein CINCED_3A016357 [Cinara cedri]|uniref:Uncharacterized protein n=1 Tax=Cinara cedri TaxID=506608 RepID=A0A5E4NNM9_9HEMI|nr:Hypothetical protein CINCED_3A016357 [Cinara cedri]
MLYNTAGTSPGNRVTSMTDIREQNDETNVIRRLALYLRPGKYWRGVRYLDKMNKYYAAGDAKSFLEYMSKYLRAVVRRTDDVARYRAMKTIDECYGKYMSSAISILTPDR